MVRRQKKRGLIKRRRLLESFAHEGELGLTEALPCKSLLQNAEHRVGMADAIDFCGGGARRIAGPLLLPKKIHRAHGVDSGNRRHHEGQKPVHDGFRGEYKILAHPVSWI